MFCSTIHFGRLCICSRRTRIIILLQYSELNIRTLLQTTEVVLLFDLFVLIFSCTIVYLLFEHSNPSFPCVFFVHHNIFLWRSSHTFFYKICTLCTYFTLFCAAPYFLPTECNAFCHRCSPYVHSFSTKWNYFVHYQLDFFLLCFALFSMWSIYFQLRHKSYVFVTLYTFSDNIPCSFCSHVCVRTCYTFFTLYAFFRHIMSHTFILVL